MLTGVGGVRTNVADYLRPPNVLKVGNNINMVTRNVITNRYSGWTRQRAGTFNTGADFLDFSIFVANNGTKTLLFQCGDTLYSYDLATETAIKSGLSTSRPPCMRMFAPYTAGAAFLVYCNGVDQPTKVTGTGAGAHSLLQLNGGGYPQPTAAPLPVKTYSKPKFCEQFRDRMLIAGFDGNNTEFDLLVTNAGTAETVTQSSPLVATDGGIQSLNPNLGAVTGLKAFKLSNETNDIVCLVAQERGVSVFVGTTAEDFALYQLTTEYGIPSNRTWVQIMNDLYFLASDGVRRFSNLASNANLLTGTMTIALQDLINRMTTASLLWAHASHMRKFQEVAFWVPADASADNNTALILNYNTESQSPEALEPIWFTKDGTTVGCSTVFNDVFYGGGYDGLLQVHYDGHLYDTTPVQSEIVMALIRGETPESILTVENVVNITEGGAQKFLCNAFPYVRKANSLERKQANPIDFAISAGVAAGTVLGTWPLGTGAFPEEHVKYHYYGPQGAGQLWELQIKATQSDHTFDWLGSSYRVNVGGLHS